MTGFRKRGGFRTHTPTWFRYRQLQVAPNHATCQCRSCTLFSNSANVFLLTQDMGLTPAEQEAIGKSYTANMAVIYEEILSRGMFSWQQMWNGQASPTDKNGCCTKPLVTKESCATSLRNLCKADSPAQTRLMMYAFSPGRCGGDPSNLTSPEQDIANFLLTRGPYAYLGHGWLGCSRTYQVPEQINWDYGTPTGLCTETSTGVFKREWTKATVSMDCNTWTPTITLK